MFFKFFQVRSSGTWTTSCPVATCRCAPTAVRWHGASLDRRSFGAVGWALKSASSANRLGWTHWEQIDLLLFLISRIGASYMIIAYDKLSVGSAGFSRSWNYIRNTSSSMSSNACWTLRRSARHIRFIYACFIFLTYLVYNLVCDCSRNP